jgi:hypothetical protein
VIIAYRLGEGPPARVSRFTEQFLGQDRRERGKVYRRRGVLDGIPHWKVSRGVLIIHREHRNEVLRTLREWTRDVEVWSIELTARQSRRMKPGPD